MAFQEKHARDDRPNGIKSDQAMKVPSVDNIRKDIESLQADVASLASNVRQNGIDRANNAMSYLNERYNSLKTSGAEALTNVEEKIKAKPRQSIAIAFAVGVIASLLLGRKG